MLTPSMRVNYIELQFLAAGVDVAEAKGTQFTFFSCLFYPKQSSAWLSQMCPWVSSRADTACEERGHLRGR